MRNDKSYLFRGWSPNSLDARRRICPAALQGSDHPSSLG